MSARHPLVSVIIPTYNRAHLVCDAIQSVLGQTYPHLEVVVVDDGSTDGTAQRVQALPHDGRLRLIAVPHRGVAAARNAGIEAARGMYVGFCDSDDVWEPHKLERQVAYLDRRVELGLVYSDAAVSANGRAVVRSYFAERPPQRGQVFHALLEQNFIPNVTVLARRACLDAVGRFNEELTSSEDYEFWLRFCRRFPVDFLDEPLVRVRRQGDNLTGDPHLSHQAHLRVLDGVVAQAGTSLSPQTVRRAYGRTYLRMGYDHLLRRRRGQAKQALLRSFRYNPWSWSLYRYLTASILPAPVLNRLVSQREARHA